MSSIAEQTRRHNREAVSRYYSRHALDILKRRLERRIYKGAIPTSVSMEKFGLKMSDVNSIRRSAGLPALKEDVYPLRPLDNNVVPSLKAEVARKLQDQRVQKEMEEARKRAEAIVQQRTQTQAATAQAAEVAARDPRYVNPDGSFKTSIDDARAFFLTKDPKTGELPVILSRKGKTLAEKTREMTLRFVVNTLTGAMNCDVKDDIVECLKQFDKIKSYIEKEYKKHIDSGEQHKVGLSAKSVQTVLERIWAIDNYYLKSFTRGTNNPPLLPDALMKQYADLQSKYTLIADRKTRQQESEDTVSPFSTIYKMVLKKFPETSTTYPWENLLIRLVDFRTVRDDFGTLKLVSNKDDIKTTRNMGFMYVPRYNKGKAYMEAFHKTEGAYGLIKTEFDATLTKHIKSYMKKNNLDYGEYLFQTNRGNPRGKMTELVRKMLEEAGVKSISGVSNKGNFNLFRHAKISQVRADKNLSVEDEQRLADAMNHLPSTSLRYLRKVVDNEAYDPKNILPVDTK